MITAEMKNMMIRDQLMNDIADIKSELLSLKQELLDVKLALQEKHTDTGWRQYND